MAGNGQVNVDGVGSLTYQRAIDIARNTEGDLDPNVKAYLDQAITDIWSRLNQNPTTYILTKDEYPVFLRYVEQFGDQQVKQQAIDRYWRNTSASPTQTQTRR